MLDRNKLFVRLSCAVLFLLCGCSRSPASPMKVRATISPEPVVGREVTWHIEMTADGVDLPNVTLHPTLPAEVELISGDADWSGDIPQDETVSVDLIIRVNAPGEWAIDAYAFSYFGSGTGFGDAKKLYITSSRDSARVVEDIDRPATRVPDLQGNLNGTSGPTVTLTHTP